MTLKVTVIIICFFLPKAIKTATDADVFGDYLSDEYLKDAEELFHFKVPQRWCQLAGLSSPPNTWTLATWISDLQNRFNHMEKILYQVTRHYLQESLGRVCALRKCTEMYFCGHFTGFRALTKHLKNKTF